MRSTKAPLFERLKAHHDADVVSFHVPGHKSGSKGYGEAERYYHHLLKIDLTEIPGLDDLHHPEEAIDEAQKLAAECFGAEQTWFLVGGSTSGNLAMIMAVCRRGDVLLVQRDAHKSVLHGLMLAGARAVFVTPRICEQTGLRLGVHPEELIEALRRYPEAKGLFVTSPSYYGTAADLKALAQLLHAHDKVLLVDEAHGAHFGFHPALPERAMTAGADAAVQSTHKMLSAMTMGAMLHVQGERVQRSAIGKSLAMIQSSSPSYPIMASLDISRRMMQEQGAALMEQGLLTVKESINRIRQQDRFRVVERKGELTFDPFKVLIYDSAGLMDGYALKEALEQRGCFPEMADPDYVLLVFSLSSKPEDAHRLSEALADIARTCDAPGRANQVAIVRPRGQSYWEESISHPVAFDLSALANEEGDIAYMQIAECAGHTAAEMIVPYPPGIPVLHRGELISPSMAAYLKRLAEGGSRFHGHDLAAQRTVPVFPDRIAPA
ncbi:aminotransferase class I/II-fold pyridoxal phosphate-dependent enzyme [Paenibacillus allorhizosphaerae]|uniref:Arginine decarboxylase n=1 Tax=Paenibacillus allorhizosphaerae TaxID=2849866 RepID=A0ABM8VSA4_9BACL|nr:aminotransferase class I/II-fold pyridoxal phosphate-dependent enzyme [Paenibacillus allorhizosphaerae]CAG7656258.1 Arginine decarboxylase [Paenibacillus allorhizosphaerae]